MEQTESIREVEKKLNEATQITTRKFGTFDGVFTPTVLTILGVIMYLRHGWVVGNAGLLGAWTIIGIACLITLCTALSLSTITTNIKMGAGGAFSIISQSLGLEVGGAIGITLYISQALAVTMYIFGFRDGWMWLFPTHNPLLVDIATFSLVYLVGSISASLAFKIQHFIMIFIVGSLISILAAAIGGSMVHDPQLWGSFKGSIEDGFQGASFWLVFAVFFPAATGVMAGANMSGDLKDPRKSIPVGTLSAVILSTVIYLLLAYWLARSATTEELLSNYNILIDKAQWGWVVVAGLFGATFSSALSSLVGAPRILQALGEHSIIPGSKVFSRRDKIGEPRNAMMLTGVIVMIGLMLRDLNAIAPVISMFFLITYLMVNVVVLIEQSLALPSFRPTLKVHRLIPMIGSLGCLFAMLVISAFATTVAVVIVLAIYVLLSRAKLTAPFGDVRSGLFGALAEWAAQRVTERSTETDRAWKPSFLIPVIDTRSLRGEFHLLKSILLPKGSAKLIGMVNSKNEENLRESVPTLARKFRDEGIFASHSFVEVDEFGKGIASIAQSLNAAFFKPNSLFLAIPTDRSLEEEYKYAIRKTHESGMSVMLFADDPKANLGLQQTINVWVPCLDPHWTLNIKPDKINAAILVASIIRGKWNAKVNLVTCVSDLDYKPQALEYLRDIRTLARFPSSVHVFVGKMEDSFAMAPQSDLDILAMPDDFSFDQAFKIVELTRSANLFVWDAGNENAFA